MQCMTRKGNQLMNTIKGGMSCKWYMKNKLTKCLRDGVNAVAKQDICRSLIFILGNSCFGFL